MKVSKRTPPRRPAPVAPPIAQLLDRLKGACASGAAGVLDAIGTVDEWTWPKTDLFLFVDVLDCFDAMLADTLARNGINATASENENEKAVLQTTSFAPDDKRLLLAILRFSRLLIENSTNRTIYNSFDRLNALLGTSDLDVLLATLRLIHRPAQRLAAQRYTRHSFDISPDAMLAIIRSWGTKEAGFDLIRFPTETSAAHPLADFQFYSSPSSSSHSSSSTSTSSKAQQRRQSLSKEMLSQDGLMTIILPPVDQQSVKSVFDAVVAKYNVPASVHSELFDRLRFNASLKSPDTRKLATLIRLYAISIYSFLVNESRASSELFLYQPTLVADLVETLQRENIVDLNIQASALYALESITVYNGRIGEVMNALNVAANHGNLMFILRQVVHNLESDDTDIYPAEFIDALFSLVTDILVNQTGGPLMLSAGIVPTLIHLLSNKRQAAVKIVSRCVNILDVNLYGLGHPFDEFLNAGGLDVVVSRIAAEIEFFQTYTTAMDVDNAASNELPYDHVMLVKNMLKFLLHSMRHASGSDRVRNLVETSVIESMRFCMTNHKTLGPSIFALAVNLMAAFIHNEPTSFSVLNDKHIPGTFLEQISSSIPANIDLLAALPDAIGSICLNPTGMELVKKANPFKTLFTIFYSADHLRITLDEDGAAMLGHSIDELSRHHPDLKADIQPAIMETLRKIIDIGKTVSEQSIGDVPKHHISYQLAFREEDEQEKPVKMVPADTKSEDIKDPLISQYIEIAARFLEGYVQHAAICREFIDAGGVDILLQIIDLPTLSFDFGASAPSLAISQLFRMMSEYKSQAILDALLAKIKVLVDRASTFLNYNDPYSILAKFVDLPSTSPDAGFGNEVFRSLIPLYTTLGLYCDVYTSPVFSQSKTYASIMASLTSENGLFMIEALGKIYRVVNLESLYLKASLPKSWLFSKPSKPTSSASNIPELKLSPLLENASSVESEVTGESSTSAGEKRKDEEKNTMPDPDDRRIRNTRAIKFVLSHLAAVIVPLYQGLIKILLPRRAEAIQRDKAITISESIANVLVENLKWSRVPTDLSLTKLHYIHVCSGLIQTLITDERNENCLQTLISVSLEKVGGYNCLIDRALELMNDGMALSQDSLVTDKASALELKDKVSRLQSTLESIFSIFSVSVSSKAIHDSPHTTNIVAAFSDSPSIDPYVHLVKMRLKILRAANDIWSHSYLRKCPASLVKLVLQIYTHVLEAEGEKKNEAPLFNFLSAIKAIKKPSRPVLDETRITTLTDMGFPRAAAEVALLRSGQNVTRATEFLLSHPDPSSLVSPNAPTTEPSAPSSERAEDGPFVVPEEAEESDNEDGSDDGSDSYETIDEEMDDVEQEPSDGNNNQPESVMQAETSQEKGKQKMQDELQALEQLRDELRGTIIKSSINILDDIPTAVFDVKDLLVLLCKNKKENVEVIFESLNLEILLDAFCQKPDEAAFKILGARVHLLALLCSDSSVKLKFIKASIPLLQNLILAMRGEMDLQIKSQLSNVILKDNGPTLIATVLLIIESCLSMSDEPKLEKLSAASDPTASSSEDEDKVPPLSNELQQELVQFILSYLKSDKAESTPLNSVYRLLVRLTRDQKLAKIFYTSDVLLSLMDMKKERSFQAQTGLATMTFRHMIENERVLQALFEKEIVQWLSSPRERKVDLSSYIKNFSHFILRNPIAFINATESVCRLVEYEPSGRQHQLCLIKAEKSESKDSQSKEKKVDVKPAELFRHSEMLANELSDFDMGKCIVHLLIDELLADTKVFMPSDPPKQQEKKNGKEVDPESKMTEEESARHFHRCFVLQVLSELLTSFPPLKAFILSYKRKNDEVSDAPKTFLLHLLNDLIPLRNIQVYRSAKGDDKRRLNESQWATNLLVAMCTEAEDLKKTDEKLMSPVSVVENITLRKFVLDTVAKALKDAPSSAKTVDQKYGYFYALSEVSSRILVAPRSATLAAASVDRSNDASVAVAKVMIDRGFVMLLTNLINEIDINYPDVQTLLNAILKPLEQLSKLANKHSKNTSAPPSPSQSRLSLLDSVTVVSPENERNDSFIRDSALGVYSAAEDSESGSEDDDDDMIDEDTEEDMLQDEEFTDVSDAESMSEESGDDEEMEMEVVVEPEFDDEDESEHSNSEMDDDEPPELYMDRNNNLNEEIEGDEDGQDWWTDDGEETGPADETDADEDDHTEDDDEDEVADYAHEEDQQNDDDEQNEDDINDEHGWSMYEHDAIDTDDQMDIRGGAGSVFRRDGRGQGNRRFRGLDILTDFPQDGPRGSGNNVLPFAGGSRGGQTTLHDSIGIHPLLRRPSGENTNSQTLTGQQFFGGRGDENNDLQMLDNILSGQAFQFLEQFLNRATASGRPGTYRIEMGGPRQTVARVSGPGMSGLIDTMQLNVSDNSTDFHPLSNNERWWQECRLFYGSVVSEKAARVTNSILNKLLPIAKEENKKRKEEQEAKKKEEEERLAKEEAEKARKAEEKIEKEKVSEAPAPPEITMETETSSAQPQASSSSTAASPNIITIHGTTVDLTNTGIDPTFLEALPDELRAEVLAQHLREQDRPILSNMLPTEISSEFLDALPVEIREEILEQERAERQRAENRNRPPAAPVPGALNADAFMTAFAPFLGGPGVSSRSVPIAQTTATSGSKSGTSTPKKSFGQREPIQLIDKAGMFTMVKLLFLPQPLAKTHLTVLLTNLCENSKSRADLLSLLISIIAECTNEDVSEKSDSKGKAKAGRRSSFLSSIMAQHQGVSSFGFARMIVFRALEACYELSNRNEQAALFYLTEMDPTNALATPGKQRKNKGKQKAVAKYPLMTLLSLLEKPLFLKNDLIMEQLTQLIATVTKPLSKASKEENKNKKTEEKEDQEGDNNDNNNGEESGEGDGSSTQAPQSNEPENPPPAPDGDRTDDNTDNNQPESPANDAMNLDQLSRALVSPIGA